MRFTSNTTFILPLVSLTFNDTKQEEEEGEKLLSAYLSRKAFEGKLRVKCGEKI